MPQESEPPIPDIPDPNGPPKVSEVTQAIVCRALSLGLKVVIGGTAALMVLACFPQRTLGALRSQRMKWEDRRKEIAQVQAESPAAATQPDALQAEEPNHE